MRRLLPAPAFVAVAVKNLAIAVKARESVPVHNAD